MRVLLWRGRCRRVASLLSNRVAHQSSRLLLILIDLCRGNYCGDSVLRMEGVLNVGIQDWPQDIVLVNLAGRPQEDDDLQRVLARVQERGDCSVVVDFSCVGVAGCTMLTRLLELRRLLLDRGQQLVLCGVAPATKGIFALTRLDEVFDFVSDRFAARAYLQRGEGQSPLCSRRRLPQELGSPVGPVQS